FDHRFIVDLPEPGRFLVGGQPGPASHLLRPLRLMRPAPLLLCAALCGCSEDPHFPRGFLFGTAVAGFQVEMGCPTLSATQCEDRASDWYQWITRPELVADSSLHLSGDPPAAGPGFFELYQQDLDRARNELHSNAIRISLEWSSIFPRSPA